MILYDKKCNLLGISRDVLSFLGYEDIEEFKTYTNDLADLFVNKSGYVYKFQNFSWIDYILHSGAPNKNAIIKLKSGKEIETRIVIEEIMLINPIGDNQALYKIDLFNNFLGEKSDQNAQTSNLNTIPSIFNTKDTFEIPEEQNVEDDFESIEKKQKDEFQVEIEEKEEESAPKLMEDYDFSNNAKEEISSNEKLKINEEIFEQEKSVFEISDTKEESPLMEDYDFDEQTNDTDTFSSEPKLKIDDSIYEEEEIKPLEEEIKLDFDQKDENENTYLDPTIVEDYDFSAPLTEEKEDISFELSDDPVEDNTFEISMEENTSPQEDDENFGIKIKNDIAQDLIEEDNFIDSKVEDFEEDSKFDELEISPPQERIYFEKDEPEVIDEKIESSSKDNYLKEATLALGIDEDMLRPIVKDYVEQLETSLHLIEEAFMQHDTQTLIEVIEQLKGVSENLRLTSLTEVLVAFLNPWDEIPANNFEKYENILNSLKEELL